MRAGLLRAILKAYAEQRDAMEDRDLADDDMILLTVPFKMSDIRVFRETHAALAVARKA